MLLGFQPFGAPLLNYQKGACYRNLALLKAYLFRYHTPYDS